MKVILEQDVAKIGKRGAVVEVPNGYALNQLIPKGMAKPATAHNVKAASQQAAATAGQQAADADAFMAAAAAMRAAAVTVTAEANEQGHLFKAVSADEIVQAAAALNIALSPKYITFSEPIKSVGAHELQLAHAGQKETVVVTIAAA